MNRKILVCALFFAASAAMIGCQSAEVKPTSTAPLASMQIMPENPEVTEGGSVELTAVGYDAAKNQIAVSPTWSLVSGSYAGKLDAPQKSGNKAMFNGIRAGKVVIQVVQNGIKAQITVTVQKMTAVQAKGMK